MRCTLFISLAALASASCAHPPAAISQLRPNWSSSEIARVSGLSFQLVTDAVWWLPGRGDVSSIFIALNIENESLGPLRLNLIDTEKVSLQRQGGKSLFQSGGRDALRAGYQFSPTVEPKQSYRWTLRAQLDWTQASGVRLTLFDDFGGNWRTDGVEPGSYLLSVRYETGNIASETEESASSPTPWRGQAEMSVPVNISLRLPSSRSTLE